MVWLVIVIAKLITLNQVSKATVSINIKRGNGGNGSDGVGGGGGAGSCGDGKLPVMLMTSTQQPDGVNQTQHETST